MPTVESPPAVPFMDHVILLAVVLTLVVNCMVCPTSRSADAGDTVAVSGVTLDELEEQPETNPATNTMIPRPSFLIAQHPERTD
jgi:hypothetical protein